MSEGVSCFECGSQLKVVITGGEFLVREGSSLDNLNFEATKVPTIITLDDAPEKGEIDDDTTLTVEVCCSKDPGHRVFATAASKVKVEVFQRIRLAAGRFIQKYA